MPVPLSHIRDELLPGIHYWMGREGFYALPVYEEAFAAPIIPLIRPSIPGILAVGAAAAVIANPETTRRGLLSWWSSR